VAAAELAHTGLMAVAIVLTLAGSALGVFGLRIALERPRPLNLLGMLLAPAGLALAFAGVGRWLSPAVAFLAG
jgi:hypothetical protein